MLAVCFSSDAGDNFGFSFPMFSLKGVACLLGFVIPLFDDKRHLVWYVLVNLIVLSTIFSGFVVVQENDVLERC